MSVTKGSSASPLLDDTGAQQLFRVVAAACECRALGIASHWPFESGGAYSEGYRKLTRVGLRGSQSPAVTKVLILTLRA